MPDDSDATPTASPRSISAESLADDSATTTWWLEEKTRKGRLVSKSRRPIPAHIAQRHASRSVGGVTYARHAYEQGPLRVTVDREVTTADGRGLAWVVVEVKGRQPRWLRSILGKPRRDFSKRRFVTRKVAP